ncbi:MAG: glutamine-hydrolyzing carbamoyl-phosphate synthase small subunit [Lautropia sp.]
MPNPPAQSPIDSVQPTAIAEGAAEFAGAPGALRGALSGSDRPRAALVLADGTVFHGESFGAAGFAVGEVVFNTSMTGYQEILTDPSYCRQIVTLTYPQIGNTGVNDEDVESDRIQAEGLIVKALPAAVSNWRSTRSLPDYLAAAGKPGIAGIDTRRLTRLLREHGAQSGCIVAAAETGEAPDIAAALAKARAFPGLAGLDLAKVVSVAAPYRWREGTWALGSGYRNPADEPAGAAGVHNGAARNGAAHTGSRRHRIVAFDFGVKRNILRMLADRGCELTVVPATTTAEQALGYDPDGIFLANGPGDPEPCDYAIAAARTLIERGLPVFGICLGHQIMGLASGARTMKMKFGHHGANHPVKDLETGQVLITSQNHGFAVDPATLPANLRVTHVSLFDGSIQGLARTDRPAFCFQGHPEASPGPHDIGYLFDRFVALIDDAAKAGGERGAGAERSVGAAHSAGAAPGHAGSTGAGSR